MGRKGSSGMSGGAGAGSVAESEAAYSGGVKSLNGVSVDDALDDYWNTGKRNAKNVAKVLGQKGEWADEEEYAAKHTKDKEKVNQQILDKYEKDPSPYNKDRADYIKRTQKTHSEYMEQYRQDYRDTRSEVLDMASADVAKRMGYNISGSTGDFSSSALNRVMGKANADALRERVLSSAKNR